MNTDGIQDKANLKKHLKWTFSNCSKEETIFILE